MEAQLVHQHNAQERAQIAARRCPRSGCGGALTVTATDAAHDERALVCRDCGAPYLEAFGPRSPSHAAP